MRTILLSLIIIPLIAFIANYVWIVAKDPYLMKEFGIYEISKLSEGKSILITGANAGLGYSSAKLIAQAGTAKVIILGCRNIKKCEDSKSSLLKERNNGSTSSPMVASLYLDLTSIESVKNFASQVQGVLEVHDPDYNEMRRSAPKLDILMNNAGTMGQPREIMEETGAEIHMHVNHLAHFALTSLLSKNLEGGGRVVNVSSLAASKFELDFNDMNLKNKDWFLRNLKFVHDMFISYGASKRANLLFTHGINQRLLSKGIDSVASHPGYSSTTIMLKWHNVSSFVYAILTACCRLGGMTSDYGALTQVRAAFDVENVLADSYVGPLFMTIGKPVIVGSSINSLHHFNGKINGEEEEINNLWEYSEKSLGMQLK